MWKLPISPWEQVTQTVKYHAMNVCPSIPQWGTCHDWRLDVIWHINHGKLNFCFIYFSPCFPIIDVRNFKRTISRPYVNISKYRNVYVTLAISNLLEQCKHWHIQCLCFYLCLCIANSVPEIYYPQHRDYWTHTLKFISSQPNTSSTLPLL